MTYHRGMSGSIRRGFGFATGWMLFRLTASAVALVTGGVWSATKRIHPIARWILRGALIAAVAVGFLLTLSDI